MSADLVERLHWDAAAQRSGSETEKLEREAADEIERLRADVALWRDRCEAEHQVHMATIKHTETALREIYAFGAATEKPDD